MVIVRPFNVYGPNQVGVGAVHHFIVRAIRNDDLIIHDDGSQIRAWCYVDDFIHGLLLTLSNDISVGRSYNIGNPRSTVTTYNLAKSIIVATNSESQLRYKKMDFQDVALRIPNIEAARRDLDFEPKVELDDGLRLTAAWYREKLGAV